MCVTHIGERASDIYEEWVRVPDAHTHLLVCACRDRRLQNRVTMLYETLRQQPVQGAYAVAVMAAPRHQHEAREAWLAVRFTPVTLRRPKKVDAHDYPESVSRYAVEANEVTPPPGVEPIQWYRWRWQIEQFFALLKRVGLDLESTRLESVKAIERLTILALMVALRILQLKTGRADETLSASVTCSTQQQQCLKHLMPTLQGRTRKQQNPFSPGSLPWATWLIARMGGWSGDRSQLPPGIRTLSQGLQKFEAIFEGWSLAQSSFVCT